MKLPFRKDKKEDTKKRGGYRKQECQYCHKFYGNLANHIRLKHSKEAEAEEPVKPVELTREKLLGEEDKKPKPTIYYCLDCKAELRKGEKRCWNCGASLVWDGID